MDNPNRNSTNEFKEAEKEKNFSRAELLAEIKPLIADYFLGEFEIIENKIVCNFLNGQVFYLAVV